MIDWRRLWWVARIGFSLGALTYAAYLVLFTAPR